MATETLTPSIQELDNMRTPDFFKYPRISHLAENLRLLNHDVEIYEKLDGGTAQIRKYKGRILAGNRSKFLTDKDKKFDWFGDFLRYSQRNYSLYNLDEDLIVFGEWLSKHTLDYDIDNMNKFYLIDLYDINDGRFLNYNEGIRKLDNLGIEGVEHLNKLYHGKIDVPSIEKLVDRSDYRKGEREGLIIKNYSLQWFSKLWASSINRKHVGISDSEVKRAIMTMVESGFDITRELVMDEIQLDLLRQNIKEITRKEISKVVNKYFEDPTNLY